MAGHVTPPMTAAQMLDREFLEVRVRLLEVAAMLDRWQLASGTLDADPRRQNIDVAVQLLAAPAADRAERIQLLFSRPFEPAWREHFQIPAPSADR